MILYCIVTAFFNVLASVVLGLSVLFKGAKKRENQMFSWFTASFAVWSYFYLQWQLADNADEALAFSRLLLAASAFIPVSYYHFVVRLTGTGRGPEVPIGYLIAVVVACFAPTPYLVSHVEPELMFPYWPKGGPVFIPYIIYFAYFTVRAWMRLFSAYRASSHSRRNQLGYVILSTVIGWVGGLTNFLLWFDVPVPPVGNGLALIYILGVGYAIIRFRLVEVDLFVVRLISYGLFVVVLAPTVPIVLHTAAYISGQPIDSKNVMAVSSVTITAFLLLVIHLLKWRVDQLLEGTLLREELMGRNQLRSLAQRVSSISNEESMHEEVILSVSDALETSGAAMVLRGELDFVYTVKAAIGFPDDFKDSFRLDSDDVFIAMMERSREAALTEELGFQTSGPLSQRAEELSEKYGIAAAIPVHADTVFFGALFLKPRARHRLFASADLSLLDAIGLQIGLNLRSRQLERRAGQTEKLISLGTLAAGLAHELRNPLVSIKTNAALLQEGSLDAELQREFSEIMHRDVARIVGIVENISSFATRDTVKFTSLNISEVIDSAYEITQSRFKDSGVAFVFENRDAPYIYGNYNQLLQVFINLFQNGIEALETIQNGRIEVSISSKVKDVINPSIEVAVKDNGTGIEPGILDRLFDPLFSTKSTGERVGGGGMGLGLSIVKRVIDSHHGTIRAENRVNEAGTQFLISLPLGTLS